MTNNVKRIIACTLTISAFSVTPVIDCNEQFTSAIAYADTVDKSSLLLDGISLSDGEIDFSPDVKSYTVKVKKNVDDVDIRVSPQGSDKKIKVTIDGNVVDESDDYKYNVELDKGDNVFLVRIQSKSNPEKEETYTLNIRRSTSTSDQSDLPDDIYLDYLLVGTEEVELSKDKLEYTVNVGEFTEEIKIKAEPEHDSYEVKINNEELKTNSNYKKTVSLNKGENIFKIKLKDDDDVRIYTIKVNRGKVSTIDTNAEVGSTSNNLSGTDTVISSGNTGNTAGVPQVDNSLKPQQWVQVNGKWQYNDSMGNPIKNAWFLEKSSAKYYFLQPDGFRATGWLNNNNHWYYLDNNGEMQTGWKFVDGEWYLLDTSGEMKIGWFQDSNGEWYYLNSDGKMKTGWLKNSTGDYYYLNADGKMQTGWLKENDKWYYLNSDGRMETSTAVVDGKTYYFNENGELK